MKKVKNNAAGTPRTGRQKLFAASSMLLIAFLLLTGTTFAWLTLSLAPEVTGIATQVGANGSLEIALLNSETRQDLSKIQTGVGTSLANDKTANQTWGNLIDVNNAGYGLSEITLMPARLNVTANADGTYTVGDNLLSVPTYGYDGRIVDLTDNTLSAVFNGKEFSGVLGNQDYGVRAIGTSSAMSVQGSALALAKTNIVTYTNSAKTSAASAMTQNGSSLMNIVLMHTADSSALHDDKDKATLVSMLNTISGSQQYIDQALRQGLVAYAASSIADEDLFNQVRGKILDTATPIASLLADESVTKNFTVPASFLSWVEKSAELKNNLDGAIIKCNEMTGGSYTWTQIREVMDTLMNLNKVYVGETLFGDMSASDFTALMGKDFSMTLAPGSGVFADIADFTDNLSFWMSAMGSDVEVSTLTAQNPPYLLALSVAVDGMESADGSVEGESVVKITDTYGYALDMAFRCNAPLSDLLLQTSAIQRINGESSSPSTMGGGSYMEFSTDNLQFSTQQMLALMDAVRVAFVDDMGHVLGIAKLNTSNRTILNGVITAPLYLYDFTLEADENSGGTVLVMGERRKTDNTITALDQNVAKAMTTLVWLDGDLVDNTMVSAESEHSLTGVLNLQFASSANLVPADNSELLYLTPDKDTLSSLIEENRETYDGGQMMYTTTTWTAFARAFEYAETVFANANANEMQVYAAATRLSTAAKALEKSSVEILKEKIDEIRTMMGQTTDLARYVLHDVEGKRYYTVDPYTEEQKDNKVGEIYRVDYNKNLKDEGNGVMAPIYTDASWSNLAAALYDAEVLYQFRDNAGELVTNPYTDFADMDAAILALQVAYDALERRVLYVAYEYEGSLYYYAISDETDTYGKWYDSDHNRVVSDLTILKLDANAELAAIGKIQGLPDYIEQGTFGKDSLSPYIEIMDTLYPELKNEEILAIQWGVDDKFVMTVTPRQTAYLTELIDRATTLGLTEAANAAQAALDGASLTMAQADAAITVLEAAVLAKEAEQAGQVVMPEIPLTAPMTADDRTLLTTAISVAKSIEGYNDLTKTELDSLRAAVTTAETLLSATDATVGGAKNALDALNAQLTANDMKQVTPYNTLEHFIPFGSELFDVTLTYTKDDGGNLLAVKQDGPDQTGTATVKAVVLTRSGILFTVEKKVQIYAKAEGLNGTANGAAQDSVELTVGGTADLKVALQKALTEQGEALYAVNETPKKYTWACGNLNMLAITPAQGSCAITATATGSTTVSVSVETDQGNTYTMTFDVTVTG